MAAKKTRSRTRRPRAKARSAAPLLAGLTGAAAVALLALQWVPERGPSVREAEAPAAAAPERAPKPAAAAPATADRSPTATASGTARRTPAPEPAAAAPAVTRETAASSGDGAARTTDRDAGGVRLASPVRPRPSRRQGLARVAVVIDDCGYDLALMKRFARLRIPITFAVIPHLEHSRASAEEAFRQGKEVILHQPMQPEGYPGINPGEGALLRGMGRSEVSRILRRNLAAVPHLSGLNNHMGSAATADPALMAHVLGELTSVQRRNPGFYFLDSKTSAATVAYDTARRAGIPTAMRSVFLDHDERATAVSGKLEELLETAEEQGEAIGIGHVKGATLTALEALLAGLGPDEFEFVFVSELAR